VLPERTPWSAQSPNPRLERTVILHRVRAASAALLFCARGAHEASARRRSTARYTLAKPGRFSEVPR
jgi:hypothetical protein